MNGQVNETLDVFLENDRKVEIFQEVYVSKQTVFVKRKNGDVLKKYDLELESDPCHFKGSYSGERKFVVIGGRYRFYILNVSTGKLIGPIQNSLRVEGEDAQTGVLYAYKILANGQYLFVNALDNGLTCFSLLDLYHPEEVFFLKADSIFHRGTYVFIDNRKENIFNVITASCGNYNTEIASNILFQGYRFQLNEQGNLKYKNFPQKKKS